MSLSWSAVASWLTGLSSAAISFFLENNSAAINEARQEFMAYAATDEYTSMYETIVANLSDDTKTNAEKLAEAVAAGSSDAVNLGEYYLKAWVEIILAELGLTSSSSASS